YAVSLRFTNRETLKLQGFSCSGRFNSLHEVLVAVLPMRYLRCTSKGAFDDDCDATHSLHRSFDQGSSSRRPWPNRILRSRRSPTRLWNPRICVRPQGVDSSLPGWAASASP